MSGGSCAATDGARGQRYLAAWRMRRHAPMRLRRIAWWIAWHGERSSLAGCGRMFEADAFTGAPKADLRA